jgi:hypothetical protein
VATTYSPALWQASRTSIKKLTSMSLLGLSMYQVVSYWLLPLLM